MTPEKTQKGNPYRLTIHQHVFPTRSIERFAGVDRMVSVRRLATNKVLRVHPNNPMFSAIRIWDQRAEGGYMKGIENKFQGLATRIVNGLDSITTAEHASISAFFALWHLRSHRKQQPEPDHYLNGLVGEYLTKDQQEILEYKHCVFAVGKDAKVPGRMILGSMLQIRIDQIVHNTFRHKHWGILKAKSGHFLVPDIANLAVIPLSPTICLVCGYPNSTISESEVGEINRRAAASAIEYLIAHDLTWTLALLRGAGVRL